MVFMNPPEMAAAIPPLAKTVKLQVDFKARGSL
jgi:hypothetical protein